MLVSVVISAYNYETYLDRAIQSVLHQTLPRDQFEIVVVDDASEDGTTHILDNYKDEIVAIELSENVGLAKARNLGILEASGQFVLFLDADDTIHPDLLQVQTTFLLENTNLDAVSADYHLMDDKERKLKHVSAEDHPIACGIMFRRAQLLDVGLYDPEFRAREEEEFRHRFCQRYKIYNIILPLYRYRQHESNLTKDDQEMSMHDSKLKEKHGLGLVNKNALKLDSDRIWLESLTLDHVSDDYVNWLNDPEVVKGLESPPSHYTEQMLIEYIYKMMNEEQNYMLGIFEKTGQKHVGNIKLHNFNSVSRTCELGIMIGDKNFWGKGIGSEACTRMIQFAFEDLKMHKVWLSVHSNNPRAIELYRRLGFQEEGTLIKHTLSEGEYVDKVIMGTFNPNLS